MNHTYFSRLLERQQDCSRRQFLGGAIAAAATAPLLAGAAGMAAEEPAKETKPASFQRKIKLGLVGCGGRGAWIGGLFQQHGGYELHAVADYFQDVADKCGDKLGVAKNRRFSGLSGYQKVIQSGIEAVALIVPPCFFSEQAVAAAEAGLHVYMAKPVAIDVHGCLKVEAAAKQATQKQHVFLVDYQIPTDPSNIEVRKLVLSKEMGKIVKIITTGTTGTRLEPPKTATIADRLQHLIWDNDMEIGGSFIVSFDIHAIHAALWVVGQPPVSAMGASRINRPNANGTSQDTCAVVFEYADGLIHEHTGQALANAADGVFSHTGWKK
jgi:myo-inositol 2-dehydrogenase / D-chiro-inositol 1-dehydrogenase